MLRIDRQAARSVEAMCTMRQSDSKCTHSVLVKHAVFGCVYLHAHINKDYPDTQVMLCISQIQYLIILDADLCCTKQSYLLTVL